jgi:dTDP-4-amino-4,6-dideoxygalactose transaminase
MEAIVPFNRPTLQGDEQACMAQALANGHISGDGPFTRKCHEFLEVAFGLKKALLTTSCTDALELAALLLEIAPGDEVIIPSFTFVSTINAFVLRGARPVFVDIRTDTLNIDETLLDEAITPRTKAIVVVHYAGVGCEMDPIMAVAQKKGIPVIEDNAHGLFGKYKGRLLGTFGCLATQSFHETKNFTCGEGGALFINESRFIARAEILREKGTDRSRFLRGQVDKYGWVDLGSSFLPSDMLAAFLYAQLEAKALIQAKRTRVWNTYSNMLAQWADQTGVRLPFVPEHCEQSYHMFYVLMRSIEDRQALIQHLKQRAIMPAFHYLPLHLSIMGRRFGGQQGQCPITEDMSGRLLRLPFYNDLSKQDQTRVVDAVQCFSRS